MMTHDDTQLVLRAASGDGDAFGRLVGRHVRWVLQRVARRLASRPDAEDLVQEILLAAYQQLPELRDPERFGAWLAGIADNKLRMWHRRQAVQLRWLEANGEDVVEGARAEAPEDRAVRSLVRRAVGRLTPVQREVVVQHYLKGYSYQQVAGFLGVGTGTVRSRLQKARRRLQQEVMDMPESMLGTMQFELKARDARALRSAIEFVSRDPTRPILQSVLLDAGGWLVATDGSALFRWRAEGLTALAAPVVLGPWPGLDLPGQAAPVTLSLEEEAATLSTGKTEVVVGVMEGPYVKYEEAVGDPGPIVATMRGAEFQASLVEIEPFLAPKHPLAGLGGWSYRPFVRVSLSCVEQSLTMSTTRDLGYDAPLQREKGLPTEVAGPDWEFSTHTKAAVSGLTEGEFRVGINADYLRRIIDALALEQHEELCIHVSDERPQIHFTVSGGQRSAVAMPVRMVPEGHAANTGVVA